MHVPTHRSAWHLPRFRALFVPSLPGLLAASTLALLTFAGPGADSPLATNSTLVTAGSAVAIGSLSGAGTVDVADGTLSFGAGNVTSTWARAQSGSACRP